MRVRFLSSTAAALAIALASPGDPFWGRASACYLCGRNPCVMVAQPAYQCVTEMVPYTVMRPRIRMEYDTVTRTVMVREPITNWVERQRVVCRPVYDTIDVPCQRMVCRPINETTYVTQTYTVCKPVQTTQQVTTYCMQPTTQMVTVRPGGLCGLCHKNPCGCQTVAQTCYVPVPVVKNVVVTQMVPETKTRQVPVTRTHYVHEVVNDVRKITKCRMVQEVVNEKVPCTTWRCVPKTVTRQIPRPVCETVPVTCYRRVTRMVPCAPAQYATAAAPTAQAAPSAQAAPAPQAAPSKQAAPAPQAAPAKQL